MSKLSLTRDKIYRTVARQLHGVVPCWVCGQHVLPAAATLEHIQPLSEGGNSHAENLAISHDACNHQRHAKGALPAVTVLRPTEGGAVMTELTLSRVNEQMVRVLTDQGDHVGNLKWINGAWKFKAIGYDAGGDVVPGGGPLTRRHNTLFAELDAALVSARLLSP